MSTNMIIKPKRLGEILLSEGKRREVFSMDNKILLETRNYDSDGNGIVIVGKYDPKTDEFDFNKKINFYAKKDKIDVESLKERIKSIYCLDINYN